MAYIRPPAFTRKVFNPLAMRFGMSGSHRMAVPGRKSGEMREIPVIPVEHEGAHYVVSTRGESGWVRNMRAAGGGELQGEEVTKRFRAIELPVEDREPIIAAYRAKAGKMVDTYWKRLPDPADHPVFRIEPEDGDAA
jgi:deazaflavin-dependent oxidoreductase (nitroreductase family)